MVTTIGIQGKFRISVEPTFDKRGQVTMTMTPAVLKDLLNFITKRESNLDPQAEEFRDLLITSIEDSIEDCTHL